MVTIVRKETRQEEEGDDPLSHLDNMYDEVVAPYMRDRFGMTETDHSREEIVREAEKHMRRFTAGNSVRTLQELDYLNSVEDKNLALQMYQAWDTSPSAFGTGGGRRAAFDYASSIIADPVNAVSLGVGRLASGIAGRGAREIAVEAARKAAEQTAKEYAARGVTGAALDTLKKATFASTQRQILRDTSERALGRGARGLVQEARGRVGDVAGRQQRADILTTTATDTALAANTNRQYQEIQMLAGNQDTYDFTQTMFAFTLGAVGGGLALGLAGSKLFTEAVDPMALVSQEMERSARAGIARSLREMRKSAKEASPKEMKKILRGQGTRGQVAADIKKLESEVSSFTDKVLSGRLAEEAGKDPQLGTGIQKALVLRTIFAGNPEAGTRGIKGILEDAGVPAYSPRNPEDNVTNYIGDAINALPEKLKDTTISIINNQLRKIDPKTNMTVDGLVNFSSKEASNAGTTLNVFSQMSRIAKTNNKKVDDLTVDEVLDGMGLQPVKEKKKEGTLSKIIDALQRNYISALVTHPATTAVNVIGSASASLLQSFTDITKGVMYGGLSTVTRSFDGGANLSRAKGSFGAAKTRLMNALDPNSTFDEFMDYITVRPELQKELFAYISGGIQTSKSLKGMGVDMKLEPALTPTEKGLRVFQTAYGVRLQDFYFKSQEFMNALDKQIRLKYDMSYKEFMRSPDSFDILTNPKRKGEYIEVEAKATQQTLKNIFAQPYSHLRESDGTITRGVGQIARIVEEARSIPVIGALVPFGQFFNNTVGFMMDYSGLSATMHLSAKISGKKLGRTGADPMEMLARGAVGWATIQYMRTFERENLEEGLAWFEDRVDGVVVDRKLDFPYTPFKAMARIFAHMDRDGEVPPELAADIFRTLGPESFTRGLSDLGGYLGEVALRSLQGDVEVLEAFKEGASATASTYVSGFSRFLDPFNTAVAVYRGEEYQAPDRQQGAKYVNNATRYIDQFYYAATGAEVTPRLGSMTDRPRRTQASRMLGFRESLPATNIQKMFVDIGRPNWVDGIYFDSQEAENVFRGAFFPFAEYLAEDIYNGGVWNTLSVDKKKDVLNRVMSQARQQTRERLLGSFVESDVKAGLVYQISSKNLTTEERQQALEYFNVTPETIWTLDTPQLRVLLDYIGGDAERDKELQRRVGLR